MQGPDRVARRDQGFTLTELSIASTIFMFVVAGVIASNIFGLRMIELTEPKQMAAQRARELIDQLSDDISTGWLVEVGMGSLGDFTPIRRGVKRGNAVRVMYGSDTNDFVVYYHDAGVNELVRFESGSVDSELVAWGVSNHLVFSGEEIDGQALVQDQTAMVLGVTLQFSELELTRTPVAPDRTYTSYQFQKRLTWRAR
jgi:hypothetical protein